MYFSGCEGTASGRQRSGALVIMQSDCISHVGASTCCLAFCCRQGKCTVMSTLCAEGLPVVKAPTGYMRDATWSCNTANVSADGKCERSAQMEDREQTALTSMQPWAAAMLYRIRDSHEARPAAPHARSTHGKRSRQPPPHTCVSRSRMRSPSQVKEPSGSMRTRDRVVGVRRSCKKESMMLYGVCNFYLCAISGQKVVDPLAILAAAMRGTHRAVVEPLAQALPGCQGGRPAALCHTAARRT